MSTEVAVCQISENLRQFQQISLFTDLTIYCYDGSVSAHKAMLTGVFNSLGINWLEKIDGLVLPDISSSQVDLALCILYVEGSIDPLLQLCSSLKVESDHSETNYVANQTISPVNAKDDEVASIQVNPGKPDAVSANVKEGVTLKTPLSLKQLKKIKRLSCDQCEFIAKRKDRLEKHRLGFHEKTGYGCEYCEFRSGGRYKVESHKRKAHPELKEIKKLKKITCDQCDFVAKRPDGRPRPDGLPIHKRLVHGEKYPCDQCGNIYLKEEKLTVHKLYKHDDRVHQCEKCDYLSKNKWHLMAHNRVSHSDQMFYCDQCEFACKRSGQIKRHIEVKHEGIKYYCEQCEYSAPYKGGLSRHLKIMHEGISYSCDFCEHKSSTRGNLKLHTDAKHLGIKYACDKCEFKGSQPGTLKIHKQTKHSSPL